MVQLLKSFLFKNHYNQDKVAKLIKYPANSPLAKLGIDKVEIVNVPGYGKNIAAIDANGKLILSGDTLPARGQESVITKMKEYLYNAKLGRRL